MTKILNDDDLQTCGMPPRLDIKLTPLRLSLISFLDLNLEPNPPSFLENSFPPTNCFLSNRCPVWVSIAKLVEKIMINLRKLFFKLTDNYSLYRSIIIKMTFALIARCLRLD